MLEISRENTNWPSLNMSWYARCLRCLRVVEFLVLFAILILAQGLIWFFTGVLSRISTLSGLERVASLFIHGTLSPTIEVLILMGPHPILLRFLINRTRGATTG